MKTLYLECGMGAAGDMLAAALLELTDDPRVFLEKMNSLGLPEVSVTAEKTEKCGIRGTRLSVSVGGREESSEDVSAPPRHHSRDEGEEHDHPHHHDHEGNDWHSHPHCHDRDGEEGPDHPHHHDNEGGEEPGHSHHHEHEREDHIDHPHFHEHIPDREREHPHFHEHIPDHDHDHPHAHHHAHTTAAGIREVIAGLPVSTAVKEDAAAVYDLIARAESRVHGHPVEQIHFHEVGTMDAVADVVGVCLLMEMLGRPRVVASPVHVGSGYVRCAHGVLPVPAPATALILEGVPTYGGAVRGELCTPTGAALLKHFVSEFGDRPVMVTEKIGYGMGKKDFERANCVRAFLGESEGRREVITKLECNLDDMTGEEIGYAAERLFAAGAKDVYTTAIGMKKSRPGVLLSCVCGAEEADAVAEAMMKHTSTLGIRRWDGTRYVLPRRIDREETSFGPVRVKRAEGMGTRKEKAEYEDLIRIAADRNLDLRTLRALLDKEL